MRSDADNLTNKGFFLADGTGISYNVPMDYGILFTDWAGSAESKWFIQRFFGANGEVYIRIRQNINIPWGNWFRTDNFGYNSLSSLASAMGGLPPFTGDVLENVSPNDLINKSGVNFIGAGQSGNPDSTSQWIIISHIIYINMGGSFGVQFAFAVDNEKAYYRIVWGSIREWKEL